jgi:hypothetical protein
MIKTLATASRSTSDHSPTRQAAPVIGVGVKVGVGVGVRVGVAVGVGVRVGRGVDVAVGDGVIVGVGGNGCGAPPHALMSTAQPSRTAMWRDRLLTESPPDVAPLLLNLAQHLLNQSEQGAAFFKTLFVECADRQVHARAAAAYQTAH